jgi:hypothetical protein
MKWRASSAPEKNLCLKIIHLVNRAAPGDSAFAFDDARSNSLVSERKQLALARVAGVSVSPRFTVLAITVSAHRQLKTLTDPD